MQKNDPMISIISPCYNGAKYLERYFEGILSQKYKNIEVIFVDDGSTDDTAQIAGYYGDKLREKGIRFIYIYQENAGQAAAINKGLEVFNGDYLMWLDSDDIILPDNISKKLDFLNNHPECGFVLHGIEIVNDDDRDVVVDRSIRKKPDGEDTFFSDLIYSRNIVWVPGTMLVRRECVLAAIPHRNIFVSREGQNWQLWLPLTYKFKAGYLDEYLLKCVAHNGSHSRQTRTLEEIMKREEKFIEICCETVDRIPDMTEDEKKYWNREIRIFHYKNNCNYAIDYGNRDKFNYYAGLLSKESYRMTFKESYDYCRVRKLWWAVKYRIIKK
ncbi:Glycosyl transferase family 2 [Lachnospiraceae bacterium]|nr:Glycosyl transferase family 2 [Lachnospiraceae bacterium]